MGTVLLFQAVLDGSLEATEQLRSSIWVELGLTKFSLVPVVRAKSIKTASEVSY